MRGHTISCQVVAFFDLAFRAMKGAIGRKEVHQKLQRHEQSNRALLWSQASGAVCRQLGAVRQGPVMSIVRREDALAIHDRCSRTCYFRASRSDVAYPRTMPTTNHNFYVQLAHGAVSLS